MGEFIKQETSHMTDLYEQREHLLHQLRLSVTNLGLSHPKTVKKSQELDAVINQLMNLDGHKQKIS